MPPSDAERDASSLKKVLNSKWAVWVVVLFAVLLLCVTATVAFALKARNTPKPITTHSPMTQIEARYGLADLQVSSSDGLGVDAGSTPVAAAGAGTDAALPATPQQTAPKIGPAPSAEEVAPLQSVTKALTANPVTLQTDVNVLHRDVEADLNTGVLNLNVQLGL